MKVSELGEFGLIERIAAIIRSGKVAQKAELVIGIGDDCAAWRVGDKVQLATTDTMVAGVHFSPQVAWRDVGWKIVAVNVSDIAAMGGAPSYGLITLGLPPDMAVAALDELYCGVNEACDAYGLTMVGGDVVQAQQAMITVAVVGEASLDGNSEPKLMTRAGAQADDTIAVTGHLGDAAAGLHLLGDGRSEDDPNFVSLVRAHVRPQPRLRIGQIAAEAGVRCAIDVSDGLLQDLGHICRASNLGAVVYSERLPLSDALTHFFPQEAMSLACSGGEDYELVLVGPLAILEEVQTNADAPVTVIGEMVAEHPGEVQLMGRNGQTITPATFGWDHLRRAC